MTDAPTSPTILDGAGVLRWLYLDKLRDADAIGALVEGCRIIETLVLSSNVEMVLPLELAAVAMSDPLFEPFLGRGVLAIRVGEITTSDSLLERVERGFEAYSPEKGFADRLVAEAYLANLAMGQAVRTRARFVPSLSPALGILIDSSDVAVARHPRLREEISRVKEIAIAAAKANSLLPLGGEYQRVATFSEETLKVLKAQGKPIPIILPPAAAVVLSSAASRDAIGRCAVDLHLELSEARAKFDRLQGRIVSDDVPIGESIDAVRDVQAALDKVLEKTPQRELLALSEWKDLTSIVKDVSEGATAGGIVGVLGTVLGKPAKALDERLQRRDVLHLAIVQDRFRKSVAMAIS